MAGGEGAKERRRLKRLAAQEGKGNSESTAPNRKPTSIDRSKEKISQYRSNGNKSNQATSSARINSNGGGRHKSFNENKNFHSKNNKNTTTTTTTKKANKPKIKKPKHLKRKLELTANENNKAREMIKKEIEAFESKKKLYSTRNESCKRHKTTTTSNGNAANVNANEDVVSRLNRINANLAHFPRSKDVKINPPTIINDGKMTDVKETSEQKADSNEEDKITHIKGIAEQKADNKKDYKMTHIKETSKPMVDNKKDDKMIDIKETTEPKVDNKKDDEMTDSKETSESKADNKKDETEFNSGNDDDDTSDDESIKENVDENKPSKTIELGVKENKANQSSSEKEEDGGVGNSSDESDDSSDDSDDDEPIQQRQRGRGRRGRQDTAKQIEETEAIGKSKDVASNDCKQDGANDEDSAKKRKKRYCIGRKPVTDFAIGQLHPGKVVYVKPFGVFFDIGCHSDAFCHVSRLSDDYIKAPESMFKEGDEVPKVRIVEIDRKQKRITISLQSDARIQDELKSIEERKSRKEKLRLKSRKAAGGGKSQPSSNSNSMSQDRSKNHSTFHNKITAIPKRENIVFNKALPAPVNNYVDPATMAPGDVKRARKLARRAERRAQAEKQLQDSK
uniref:S1 motif domain-containing protein n=1 Tax=Pseudo-nitzschia australis TaxID=44445 RepID=A0A7S4EQP2_9STRA|mmetsp:Transcript_18177/g.39624  ORF Transcript_18177/g.39624 Transcript_18177/m.39624 type:complete len:622 (-) Transcript_18177:191-2056(-)|eukprot:CAMPEP_0168178060 /NCGR_PEP_ID=MMETSP0139_2-20121125/8862_1 /TAXON_ID=44445 /ORGANISM="Pseudo-nitzschia australis, Strain 10249 10 AB" /LENGTH=621 /DNA_ID=CAMNT_0008097305 /DNA_START=83 /DNA_END=1948 /DNA_ORIENTATION=+